MKIKMLGTLSIEMLQYVKSKILGGGGGGRRRLPYRKDGENLNETPIGANLGVVHALFDP